VRKTLVIVPVALALLASACGSSSSSSPATSSGSSTTVHVAKKAADVPSVSAKMICEKEAIDDIYNSATGVRTVTPPKPSWDKAGHVYSCEYDYAGGVKLTLSVKEMSSADETTAYFGSLAKQLHKKADLQALGQGAYVVKDGSVVVRKDYKVLLIDVTKLPPTFGVPADTRENVAINIAETIMGCWTGA